MSRPTYSLPHLRRFLGAFVVISLLVAALAVYNGTQMRAPATAASLGSEISDSVTVGPLDSAPATITIEPEPSAANVKAPTEGPGVSEPGLLVIASPLPDGAWDISEQALLAEPTQQLTLAPADLSRAGAQFAFGHPEATTVQISAGRQPVVLPEAQVLERMTAAIPSTTQIEISYRLDGATVSTIPSTARRGLGAIMPLISDLDPELPVVVMVVGETVLSLSCPELSLSERACGRSIGDQAIILAEPLSFGAAVVTVQLDIPRL